MEATVPVPEGSSDEPPPVQQQDETPRAESEGSSGNPWARSEGRRHGAEVRAPALEQEFAQFLQWRQANQPYGMGLQPGHYGDAGQGLWQAARDEQERTTPAPPPEWDGVSTEFKDYKIKARIWLAPHHMLEDHCC